MALKSYKMYCFYHFLTEFTIFIILYRFIQYLYQWRKLNTYETMTQYKGDIDKTVRCIYQILSINLPFSILVDNIAGLCCLRVTDVKIQNFIFRNMLQPRFTSGENLSTFYVKNCSRIITKWGKSFKKQAACKVVKSSKDGANHSKNKIAQRSSQNRANQTKNKPIVKL